MFKLIINTKYILGYPVCFTIVLCIFIYSPVYSEVTITTAYEAKCFTTFFIYFQITVNKRNYVINIVQSTGRGLLLSYAL